MSSVVSSSNTISHKPVSSICRRCLLLFEEALESSCKVITGVHPGMAAVREYLLVFDTVLVIVLLMCQHVLVQAVGGAHAKPEQLEAVVEQGWILRILREVRIHCLGDEVGAVRCKPGELV